MFLSVFFMILGAIVRDFPSLFYKIKLNIIQKKMASVPPCISCFFGDRILGRVRTGVVGARWRGCEAIGYIYIYIYIYV